MTWYVRILNLTLTSFHTSRFSLGFILPNTNSIQIEVAPDHFGADGMGPWSPTTWLDTRHKMEIMLHMTENFLVYI